MINDRRIRQDLDGSLFLVRRCPELEAVLDVEYHRVKNQLRWMPRSFPGIKFEELVPTFRGRPCYIIGKGPSLDALTSDAFDNPDAPIIAINEAIHKVESLPLMPNPIFAMQQDIGLRDTCHPLRSRMIVSSASKNFYPHVQKYVFTLQSLSLHGGALTVTCAIELLKRLGSVGLILIAFDSCTNKKVTYASCIGHQSTKGGKPERFLTHRATIEKHAAPLAITWVTPRVPGEASACRPQP